MQVKDEVIFMEEGVLKISKEDFSKLYQGNDDIMMSEYLNYVENQDLKKLSLFYHFSL